MAGKAATEVELKLLLPDAAAHDRLRAALDALAPADVAAQVNYYLDTVRLDLRRQKAMVRVRVQDGRATVTVKTRARLDHGVSQAAEWERVLPPVEAAPWLQAPPSRIRVAALGLDPGLLVPPLAPDADLHVLGALANTRRTYAVRLADLGAADAMAADPDTNLALELDHSRYSAGAERFELELEHPAAADLAPAVTEWLQRLGIDAEPAAESKYAQFLRVSGTP